MAFGWIAIFVCIGLVVADEQRWDCGGYRNGEDILEGNYWYVCENGRRVDRGCSYDNKKVPLGGTFTFKEYQMRCTNGSDGHMTVEYVGCVHNGVAMEVGAEWDDGNVMYNCVKDGESVRIVTAGCMDGSTATKVGDQVAKGDFVYKCKRSADGGADLNRAGCVSQGRNYNIGETFNDDKVWYTCTDKGPDVSGCYNNGQQLKAGDHFNEGDTAIACKVTQGGAVLEAFACLGNGVGGTVDRRIGCYWIEGDAEYTCQDLGGGRAAKVMTRRLS